MTTALLRIAALPVAAVVLLLSAPAHAASFFDVPGYVGGGAQFGTVGSGNPSIDGARGPGFQVVFGRRLRDRYPVYVDLRLSDVFVDVGPTPETAFPPDRANYAVMAVGGLWDLRGVGSRGTGPWISLHGTYHNFNWRTAGYSIEGLGVSPGLGVNVHVKSVGLFRIGVTANFFSATSNYDADASGQSLQMSVDYLYAFGPNDRR